jgi:RNA polymerase sigma-70 factor (ECF subfamily)
LRAFWDERRKQEYAVGIGFDEFAAEAGPRLRRAFAARGLDRAADATSEALAFAWAEWDRVVEMENALGYLYRVGISRTRRLWERRPPKLPSPESIGLPDIEPNLIPALRALPDTQRTAVWLVHACGWSYTDTAAAMGIGISTVGTHVTRGLAALRRSLGVEVP